MNTPLLRNAAMVAIAAVVTSAALSAFALTDDASEPVQAAATEDVASEGPSEDVTAPPTEPPARDDADDPAGETAAKTDAKRRAAKAKAAEQPQAEQHAGRGNAHGKRVSQAARGELAPVGDCRNHGHWVSTVAKGLASCDDNPRPARTEDED